MAEITPKEFLTLLLGAITGGVTDIFLSHVFYIYDINRKLIPYGPETGEGLGLWLNDLLTLLIYGGISYIGVQTKNPALKLVGVGGVVYETGEEIREAMTPVLRTVLPKPVVAYRDEEQVIMF